MKKIFFCVSLFFLLPGCFEKKTNDFVVINILEKDAYNDCHIKGSMHIPFENLEKEIQQFDKKTTIVLYCSNYQCTASRYGAQMLTAMGYEHVYAYEAGMAEWYQQNLPTVGACVMPYLKEENKKVEESEDGVRPITTEQLKEKIKQKLAVALTS